MKVVQVLILMWHAFAVRLGQEKSSQSEGECHTALCANMVQNGCGVPSKPRIRHSCSHLIHPRTSLLSKSKSTVLTAQIAPCAFPSFQGACPDHEASHRSLFPSIVGCEGGKRSGGIHLNATAGDECRGRPQVCDGQRQGRSGQDQPGILAGCAVCCGGAQHPRGVHRPRTLALRLTRSGRLS